MITFLVRFRQEQLGQIPSLNCHPTDGKQLCYHMVVVFFKVNGKIESAHLKILDFVHGSLRMYPKFIFFLNTGYNFDRCSSVYTRKRTEELLKCFSLCFSIFIQPNHKNQSILYYKICHPTWEECSGLHSVRIRIRIRMGFIAKC